jgi:hypothetical protein
VRAPSCVPCCGLSMRASQAVAAGVPSPDARSSRDVPDLPRACTFCTVCLLVPLTLFCFLGWRTRHAVRWDERRRLTTDTMMKRNKPETRTVCKCGCLRACGDLLSCARGQPRRATVFSTGIIRVSLRDSYYRPSQQGNHLSGTNST